MRLDTRSNIKYINTGQFNSTHVQKHRIQYSYDYNMLYLNVEYGTSMKTRNYKQMLLDTLYTPYHQCTKCPLAGLGRTHVVFGQGNPDAKLMFIGEGPGRDEDVQGLPFVGRSGQLLDCVLKNIGIQRDDVFITNIVKCRPPGNREPLPNESTTCKNILLFNQIKIIQPKIICTLGSCALRNLLEHDIKITELRGTRMNFGSITLIPTYHPAYILRNPQKIKDFVQDLFLITSLLTP